jgi:hypothetical protein
MPRWPNKDCSGAHCHVRETCDHHALPTAAAFDSLTHPAHPVWCIEDCRFYVPRSQWGAGPETHDHD